jgi:hypothetical protein
MRVVFLAVLALVAIGSVAAFEHDFVQNFDNEVYQAKPHFVKRLDPDNSASQHRFAEVRAPTPPSAGGADSPVPEPSSAEPEAASHEDTVASIQTACGREVDCDSKEVKMADSQREANMASVENDGDKEKELEEALQSVKDEIVQKATQIREEKKWVKEVTKIVETYVLKVKRVNSNIREMQSDVKELFRKKKQIENLKLQRKLELKLKVATKDLSTLQDALGNVHEKESAFVKSKKDIRGTIGSIEDQLRKLRGEPSAQDGDKKEEGDKKKEE